LLNRHFLAADRLIRRELALLQTLGRDRRRASTRLPPLIRSGPAALSARSAMLPRKRATGARA